MLTIQPITAEQSCYSGQTGNLQINLHAIDILQYYYVYSKNREILLHRANWEFTDKSYIFMI